MKARQRSVGGFATLRPQAPCRKDPDGGSLHYFVDDVLPIDAEWLVVRFDEADWVVDCRIVVR